VKTTIVNGQVLMEDGIVLSIDQEKVIEQASLAAKRLADKAKLE
jgi:predicted RNA-binding protein